MDLVDITAQSAFANEKSWVSKSCYSLKYPLSSSWFRYCKFRQPRPLTPVVLIPVGAMPGRSPITVIGVPGAPHNRAHQQGRQAVVIPRIRASAFLRMFLTLIVLGVVETGPITPAAPFVLSGATRTVSIVTEMELVASKALQRFAINPSQVRDHSGGLDASDYHLYHCHRSPPQMVRSTGVRLPTYPRSHVVGPRMQLAICDATARRSVR